MNRKEEKLDNYKYLLTGFDVLFPILFFVLFSIFKSNSKMEIAFAICCIIAIVLYGIYFFKSNKMKFRLGLVIFINLCFFILIFFKDNITAKSEEYLFLILINLIVNFLLIYNLNDLFILSILTVITWLFVKLNWNKLLACLILFNTIFKAILDEYENIKNIKNVKKIKNISFFKSHITSLNIAILVYKLILPTMKIFNKNKLLSMLILFLIEYLVNFGIKKFIKGNYLFKLISHLKKSDDNFLDNKHINNFEFKEKGSNNEYISIKFKKRGSNNEYISIKSKKKGSNNEYINIKYRKSLK